MRKLILLSFMFFVIACASSTTPNSGRKQLDSMATVVYSDEYELCINTPNNWHFDKETASEIDVTLLLVPDGWTFSDAPAVIYTNVQKKKSAEPNNLDEFIRSDYEKFRVRNPSIQMKDSGYIITRDNKKAVIKSFINANGGQQANETVAYIDDEFITVVIVLSSQHRQYFEACLPIFDEVVSSYELRGIANGDLSIQELEQLHQLSISAPGGREYMRAAMRTFFGDFNFMKECASPDAPIAEPFKVYFQVLRNGRMGQIYFFPETPVARCIKKHVTSRNFPIPQEPFIVGAGLSFTK